MLNVAINCNYRAGHYQHTTTSNKISQHAYNGCSQAKSIYNLFRPMGHEPSFVWGDRIKGEKARNSITHSDSHVCVCVKQILLKTQTIRGKSGSFRNKIYPSSNLKTLNQMMKENII
jgi:hypothetical protein